MADLVEHAADLRRVAVLDRVVDAPQAERAQRVELALVTAVARLELGYAKGAHAGSPSGAASPAGAGASTASAGASAAGASSPGASAVGLSGAAATTSAEPSPLSVLSPSTWLIVRPRSAATSSGVRSDSRPAIVALTRLI